MNIVNSNLVPQPLSPGMNVKEKHSEFKPGLDIHLPGEILGIVAENLVFRDAVNIQRIVKPENLNNIFAESLRLSASTPRSLADLIVYISKNWKGEKSEEVRSLIHEYYSALSSEIERTKFFKAVNLWSNNEENKEGTEKYLFFILSALPKDMTSLDITPAARLVTQDHLEFIKKQFCALKRLSIGNQNAEQFFEFHGEQSHGYKLTSKVSCKANDAFINAFFSSIKTLEELFFKSSHMPTHPYDVHHYQSVLFRRNPDKVERTSSETEEKLGSAENYFYVHELDTNIRCFNSLAKMLSVIDGKHLQKITINQGFMDYDFNNFQTLRSLKQLKYLEVSSMGNDDERATQGVALIAENPNMSRLEHLSFEDSRMSREVIKALTSSPHMAQLRNLVVEHKSAIDLLIKSKHLKRLEKFTLHCLNFDDRSTGVELSAIAKSPNMAQLRFLKCDFCEQTDIGAKEIGNSYYLSRLETLDLSYCDVTDKGIAHIVCSPNMNNLKNLILDSCESITDSALESIASSPYMGNLTKLELTRTKMTDKGIKAIAASEYMKNLTYLGLFACQVTDVGAIEIAGSPFMSHLETLEFGGTENITHAAAKALAESRYMSRLKRLSFISCPLTNAAMEFIARSTTLVHLEDIELRGWGITYRSFGEISGLDPTMNPQAYLNLPNLNG